MGLAEAKAYVDRLAAEPPVHHGPPELTRVLDLAASGKQIEAIKELRAVTGLGLRDAKDYVDALVATGEPPPPPSDEVGAATLARARELVAAGKKIQAVKAVRDDTGWALGRAKDFVDRL
jgi:ribosomal protein L7/L12